MICRGTTLVDVIGTDLGTEMRLRFTCEVSTPINFLNIPSKPSSMMNLSTERSSIPIQKYSVGGLSYCFQKGISLRPTLHLHWVQASPQRMTKPLVLLSIQDHQLVQRCHTLTHVGAHSYQLHPFGICKEFCL